jgi:hypothetical protein
MTHGAGPARCGENGFALQKSQSRTIQNRVAADPVVIGPSGLINQPMAE